MSRWGIFGFELLSYSCDLWVVMIGEDRRESIISQALWLPLLSIISNFFFFCPSSFSTIISYIDDQFERYLHDESGLNRRHIVDNRVHCCFYFISPLGHGCVLLSPLAQILYRPKSLQWRSSVHADSLSLVDPLFPFPPSLKPLDVQFMKAIHNKVNVVPVIAKADTLTLRERERLKRRVRTPELPIVRGLFPFPDLKSSYNIMLSYSLLYPSGASEFCRYYCISWSWEMILRIVISCLESKESRRSSSV